MEYQFILGIHLWVRKLDNLDNENRGSATLVGDEMDAIRYRFLRDQPVDFRSGGLDVILWKPSRDGHDIPTFSGEPKRRQKLDNLVDKAIAKQQARRGKKRSPVGGS